MQSADFAVLAELLIKRGVQADGLNEETDLWAHGLDSLQVVGLILDIEERFGIGLPSGALTGDNFATPLRIGMLIDEERRGESAE